MCTSDTEYLVTFNDEVIELEHITVKFAVSDTHVVPQTYPNCMTFAEIKKDIGPKFDVDPKLLLICQCGEMLNDECRLCDAEKNDDGLVDLHLLTYGLDENGREPVLSTAVYYSKSRLPDFITVYISAEDSKDGQEKYVVVEIQKQMIVKPFLGGYKDSSTGIEQHHAFSLTGPKFDWLNSGVAVTRTTQTQELKKKQNDTPVDECLQVFGDATKLIHISTANDVLITPRKYQSFYQKEKEENKLAKIILIQRNFRRYLLWRFIKACAAEYRYLIANRAEMDRKFKEEQERKRHNREERARGFPRTKEDFGVLLGNVQKWKTAELKRISTMYSGAPRLAEVNLLLEKEIHLLSKIERQRQIVQKSVKEYREKQLLNELGEPLKWVGYKDLVIEMDLLRNQRARFLTGILKELEKDSSVEQRLQLLKYVSQIIEPEQDFPHLNELQDLIEREKNLLLYTKFCDMNLLRMRSKMIFVELIKFIKNDERKKPETRMCDCCQKVKPISQFTLLTRQRNVDTCQQCYSIKTSSSDISPYRAILRSIQREERKYRCISSYAFVLQEEDIRYIIDSIWHRHSILSKEEDLNELRLPRWIKSEDWSPWNCICLTEEEARNHNNLKNLSRVYDNNMMLEITNKHLLAKNSFKKLQSVDNDFVEHRTWWEVGIKHKIP